MTSDSPSLTRRRFLALAAPAAGALAVPRLTGAWAAGTTANDYPFTLGIASGDPRATSVVLWTRLARRPLQPDGGMGDKRVPVQWQILDPATSKVIAAGEIEARPASAHTIHAVATGLEPGRWYHYRFRALGYISPLGRTRTLPEPTAMPAMLRFATASCQSYQAGYYTAYAHMAQEDLDLVVHMGDYIYVGPRSKETMPRYHVGRETLTLDDYRVRHALYKTDPDLQRAHRRFPWMVTFDDHEVENNWTGESHSSGLTRDEFRRRKIAAFRAYWEHMPLRPSSMPVRADMPIYRRLNYGRLARISVLDTRQYRSRHACGVNPERPWSLLCTESAKPERTMTGPDQERWLLGGLNQTARWNVIAQQVMMARWQRVGKDGPVFNMDAWDGYPAARERILRHIAVERPSNPVVLTGDAHLNAVSHLKQDFEVPLAPTLTTEIITTSITSNGNGFDGSDSLAKRQALDPHVQFVNRQRGYVRHVVTPTRWRADFRVVGYVTRPGAQVKTRASWLVRDGNAAAEEIPPVA